MILFCLALAGCEGTDHDRSDRPDGAADLSIDLHVPLDSALPDSVLPDSGKPPAPRCGDGTLDTMEECDGTKLGGKTCKSQGYFGGTLGCTDQCKLDSSGCNQCGDGKCGPGENEVLCVECGSWYCGDGTAGTREHCDLKDLGGKTCKSLGFSSGTLKCAVDCTLTTDSCASKGCSAQVLSQGAFKVTTMDSSYTTGSGGPVHTGSPALAVDAKGATHLLFSQDLAYLSNMSGKWVKKELMPGTTVSRIALALDKAGKAHAVFTTSKGELRYISNSSGKWITESIEKKEVEGSISLVANSASDLGVAYRLSNTTTNSLKFARRSGKGWQKANIISGTFNGEHKRVVQDSNGKVHIATDEDPVIRIFEEQSSGWKVVGSLPGGGPNDLMADAKGALHLVFRREYALWSGTNRSGAWSSSKLPLPIMSPRSAAMDAAGHLYISGRGNGDTIVGCTQRATGVSTSGNCSVWAPVIYSNASGTWQASPLDIMDAKVSGIYLDYDANTNIHSMSFHGSRLHLSYSRRTVKKSYTYEGYYQYYTETHTTTEYGHLIKCL